MTIALPDDLKEFIEQQVARGGYANAEQYFEALVEADRRSKARERLEGLLIDGLDSGPGREMTPADWADIRRRVRERHRGESILD